jgi:hypothetical protein
MRTQTQVEEMEQASQVPRWNPPTSSISDQYGSNILSFLDEKHVASRLLCGFLGHAAGVIWKAK